MAFPGPVLQHYSDLAARAERCDGILVAFSGGIDSSALLLLSRHWCQFQRLPLKAVHVHHHLHRQAQAWADHCAGVCRQLEVAFECVHVKVDKKGQGTEQGARKARYRALAECLPAGHALVTAHHRQDQAETLLLHLMRGSGVDGLAAMPALRPFAQGNLLRPLLDIEKQQLLSWVQAARLNWIDDPSNQNQHLARNYLRHTVLPRIEEFWPAAHRAITASAAHCQDAVTALHDLAQNDLAQVRGPSPTTLNIGRLQSLARHRQNLAVRLWLRQAQLPLPGQRQLESVLIQAGSRSDAMPRIAWAGAEIRRYRQHLYCMAPLSLPSPQWSCQWQGMDCVLPEDLGVLRWHGGKPQPRLNLTVTFNSRGARLKPVGTAHHKTLKALSQEAGIPPWERRRLPCLWHRDALIAVGDLWWNQTFADLMEQHQVTLLWQREGSL